MARMVLVADDSPTIQKRALGILKSGGFEVETVSNGVAAIKRLAVLHPVVVLADVSMPGRDGYEVCDFVKKSIELSHVPVLLVASDMEPYDSARGAEVRADGIIKKPFEAQDLIAIVVKFAEQYEAAMPAVIAPVVPSVEPEPVPEFAVSSQEPEEMPTVVQPVAPDFSAVSEGVAFAEPAAEEVPAYSAESQPAEMEAPYQEPQTGAGTTPEIEPAAEFVDTFPAAEPESASATETPLAVEESPAPSPLAPPPPLPSAARDQSIFEGFEAATAEPVFIEEQPAQTSEPTSSAGEIHTMIFRAPLEIAEPVWKDETVPAPTASEPAEAAVPEPQLETQAPVAAPETPFEQPPEHPHLAASVAATSLDSFSLDDATAGQVHFDSQAAEIAPVEVAPSAPVEEAPAPEMAPSESAPEAAYAETAPQESAVEAVFAEIAPHESAPEAAYVETAPQESAVEAETPPHETAPEAVYPENAPQEAAPEAGLPEQLSEAAAPPPAFDWGLIYSVVHKAVVKMSPPALPMEVVEELARRIADEIATEIAAESSQPHA